MALSTDSNDAISNSSMEVGDPRIDRRFPPHAGQPNDGVGQLRVNDSSASRGSEGTTLRLAVITSFWEASARSGIVGRAAQTAGVHKGARRTSAKGVVGGDADRSRS